MTACHTTPADKKPPPDLNAQLQNAEQLFSQADYPGALAAFHRITALSAFNALPSALRLRALSRAAAGEALHGDKMIADHYLLRAAALPEADVQIHLRHIYLASFLSLWAEALQDLTDTVKRWPQDLPKIEDRIIFKVVAATNSLPHDVTIPLLQNLYALNWTNKYGNQPDAWWLELALFHVQHGHANEAIEVSNRIEDPDAIALARVDRRYKTLLAVNPVHFEVDAAATAWMRKQRQLSDERPQVLQNKINALDALLKFKHYSAALAAADAIVAEIESTNSPEKLYSDLGESENWLLDYRARAMVRLGRYDDALAELTRASALFEDGQSNVSQNINLAQLYDDLGRPNDALTSLRNMVGATSTFGTTQVEQVRLNAAVQLGDSKEQARALAYLSAHRRDAPATYLSALLLLNDMDAAAAWQIARLRDPTLRNNALMQSQRYAAEPLPQRSLEAEARLEALCARPDVQAALHAVGSQESFPFVRDE